MTALPCGLHGRHSLVRPWVDVPPWPGSRQLCRDAFSRFIGGTAVGLGRDHKDDYDTVASPKGVHTSEGAKGRGDRW